MKLRSQVLLVNGAILAGLIYKYCTGSPFKVVVLSGILLFSMANLIFVFRVQRSKSLR